VGEHIVRGARDEEDVRRFLRNVFEELRALELLLERGAFERGVRRVGFEQEMFLVWPDGRPAAIAEDILARANDGRLTTELAQFNLEANLAPRPFEGAFLRGLEEELGGLVALVDGLAGPARVLLTGILPTLTAADLTLAQMSRAPRYAALNAALLEARGGAFSVFIRGIEQLETTHGNIMLEAANTSLQLHLQVEPEEFAAMYNLAQLVSAPLLAAAGCSPLLLGRRLWHETRVALFERSTDARSVAQSSRGLRPRVSFGDRWAERSVLEILRDDALRYGVLLVRDVDEDALGLARSGEVPRLGALCLHNGTIWRWNRACYGITEGKPHLRIENRVLPSGPTVQDEVANAALFYGLLEGLREQAPSVPARLPFDAAAANFFGAARHGLDATFTWLDGRVVGATQLLGDELLPLARAGLLARRVPSEDVDRYLGVIEQRVARRRTGASFQLAGFARLRSRGIPEACAVLTATMLELQRSGLPVHEWPDPAEESPRSRRNVVGDVMSTDLFTVAPEDPLERAVSVMEWRRVRHVPVEDSRGRVVGVVAHRALLRALAAEPAARGGPVRAFMDESPILVSARLTLREAAQAVLRSEAGCLLVVEGERLVGIATERDLLAALATTPGSLGDGAPAHVRE
jgi:CBS domain-containing protein